MSEKVQNNKPLLGYQSILLIIFIPLLFINAPLFSQKKASSKTVNTSSSKKANTINQKNLDFPPTKSDKVPIQIADVAPTIVEKNNIAPVMEKKEYTIVYAVGTNRAVSITINNGKLKNINLYRIEKNQELILLTTNTKSSDFPVYHNEDSFALHEEIIENNFLESSWDSNYFSQSPWVLIQVANSHGEILNNNILPILYKRNDWQQEYTVTFEKKNPDGSKMHRKFIIHKSKLVVQESLISHSNHNKSMDNSSHCFSIKLPISVLQNKNSGITVFNDTSDGGFYHLKGNKNSKFFLDVEKKNGEKKNNISINKINLWVKNHSMDKDLVTNIMYDKKFLLISTNTKENNRLILLKRKKDNLEIQYLNENLSESNNGHSLAILYDFQGLDVVKQQSLIFPVIKKIMPIGLMGKIKLLIIEFVKLLMDLTRNITPVLGFILFILLVKILAIAIQHFLYKRMGLERKHVFTSLLTKSKDDNNMLLSLVPTIIDLISISIVTTINSNSSIFVMEKFLWLNDFSGYDNLSFGFSRLQFKPLSLMAAGAMMLSSIVEQQDNLPENKKMELAGKIIQVVFVLLMSLLFNFCYCSTNVYWIFNGLLSIIYFLFFKRKRKVSYKKI
jgi:hypothetical protein